MRTHMSPEPNVTPMIDVLLVLLIIFMAATPEQRLTFRVFLLATHENLLMLPWTCTVAILIDRRASIVVLSDR